MPHYPPDAQVDPIFLGVGIAICLVIAALFFHHERELRWKKKQQALSQASVDNVETIAWAIACQIRKCEHADDFNAAVRAIGRYEWEFEGNGNAEREAKLLKELLDVRANEVFGVELSSSAIRV